MKKIIVIIALLLTGSILFSESSKESLDNYPTINEENNEFIFVNQTDEMWVVLTSYWTRNTIATCDWPKNVVIPAHHKAVFHASCCLEYFSVKKPNSFFNTEKQTVDVCGRKVFYIRYTDGEKKKIKVEMEA